MIAFINGKVAYVSDDEIQIDVNGIGFSVLVPINTFKPLPIVDEEIMLFTHLQIREDAWQLFGFPEKEQLDLFKNLISVSGIGAKTALGIINNLSIGSIIHAVLNSDTDAFCKAPGVGKKTAQRVVLELKDKLKSKWPEYQTADNSQPLSTNTSIDNDLVTALNQLGYSATESRSLALKASQNLGPNADSSQLLKEALKLSLKH